MKTSLSNKNIFMKNIQCALNPLLYVSADRNRPRHLTTLWLSFSGSWGNSYDCLDLVVCDKCFKTLGCVPHTHAALDQNSHLLHQLEEPQDSHKVIWSIILRKTFLSPLLCFFFRKP